jgi:L-threonylcarbamoyladenylate synthase
MVYRRFEKDVWSALKKGGTAVIPTDTIYGIAASALSRRAVERVYRLRRRSPKKPMIVLLSSAGELRRFGVWTDAAANALLRRVWPGKVSVIFSVKGARFRYLHRGTSTIAFRVPAVRPLRALLRKTGPLVAPSANTEGKPPAKTIEEAKAFFGGNVDAYVYTGKCISRPSTVVKLQRNRFVLIRRGAGDESLRRAKVRSIIHP